VPSKWHPGTLTPILAPFFALAVRQAKCDKFRENESEKGNENDGDIGDNIGDIVG